MSDKTIKVTMIVGGVVTAIHCICKLIAVKKRPYIINVYESNAGKD